jgi:hypothetical protein
LCLPAASEDVLTGGIKLVAPVSQVSSFLFVMPVLIGAWYYLIGWLLDRWISKRSHLSTATPD